jgi:putative transport protein
VIDLLADNPFVLLFLVLWSGSVIGRVRIGGFGLGVSAVLFVGLGFGGLSPRITLPELVYQLGLILFVYTVGVSAGPGFLGSLRRRGGPANVLVLVVLIGVAVTAALLGRATGQSPAVTAGVFAGALTNTPALAAILQHAAEWGAHDARVLSDPVVGYSVAYPFGVLGMILVIWAARRLWRPHDAERAGDDALVNLTVRVTQEAVAGRSVGAIVREQGWPVVLSRVRRGDETEVLGADFVLRSGDLLVVVGRAADAECVIRTFGERAAEDLPLDRSDLDMRRIFVSASEPVGQRIGDLRLLERFGGIVTRVRRGDIDRLATADTVLEPGDRVRVVAPRERMDEITRYFGDSFRQLSEIDVAAFSIGLLAGLLVGLVPVPLPGGGTFRLGLAGGPLVIGLLLGALERTGPITWQLPYNANLTLRQLGVVLFLAGVGVRSGHAFLATLQSAEGLLMFAVGSALTCAAALLAIGLGRRVLRLHVDVLCGLVAGMQTQPAVLAFAAEQAGSDLPSTGYASVYPTATVAKIILAQVLLSV